jgi:hypothetical protein
VAVVMTNAESIVAVAVVTVATLFMSVFVAVHTLLVVVVSTVVVASVMNDAASVVVLQL